MKKIIMICILVMAGVSLQAQKISADKLPSAVLESFKKLYPTATETRWEKDKDNYEAIFKLNTVSKEIVFYADGKVVQSEEELNSINELPKEIKDAFNKEYVSYIYIKSEKITKDSGTIVYEIDAELKGKKYAIEYDAKGTFIKKTEE
jgi:hypothetical protein